MIIVKIMKPVYAPWNLVLRPRSMKCSSRLTNPGKPNNVYVKIVMNGRLIAEDMQQRQHDDGDEGEEEKK